jgi:hypothetical protein
MKIWINGMLAAMAAGLLLSLSACKEKDCDDPQNPECENYDPCFGRTLDNEILISLNFSPTPKWFQPDIRFWRTLIHFRPSKKIAGAKYTWYLGTEVIEDYEFTRDFAVTKTTKEQGIPVKLIIERPKQLDCFPDDDGIDTLERKIYFMENYCESMMVGKYKVKFDNLKDSVIIQSLSINLPVPRQWKYRTDSCNANKFSGVIWIGYNPYSKIYPDTTWSGMNSGTYYNYSSMILSSTWNGFNYLPYDGEVRVNPNTLEVSGNYLFRDENHKLTPRIYFKGRKIQ